MTSHHETSPETAISRPRLVESILEIGKRAFDPSGDEAGRQEAEAEFDALIDQAGDWSLVQALNGLIKPGAGPDWLRPKLMSILTLLPLRKNGVRASIEFVFAVHPSHGTDEPAETTEASKKGADITPEALELATRLLCVPPRSVTAEAWVAGIAPQLLDMLDGKDGPELVRAASHIICCGFLAKRQFGAPGSPGWVQFVDPILQSINPSLRKGNYAAAEERGSEPAPDGHIVDLAADRVLTGPRELVLAVRRLMCLVLSSPYPSQCRRMISPILLPLWSLASWPSPPQLAQDNFCIPARSLLDMFFKIAASTQVMDHFVQNLLWDGDVRPGRDRWVFQTTPDGKIQIVQPRKQQLSPGRGIESIPQKSEALVELLTTACSREDISAAFLMLFERWLASDGEAASGTIKVKETTPPTAEASVARFAEVMVLQKMMEKSADKLISQFHQLVALICRVMDADGKHTLPEEVMTVTLSLLNLVLTSPTFQKSQLKPADLSLIDSSLKRLEHEDRGQIGPTARNLATLLESWDDIGGPDRAVPSLSDGQREDRKTYSLAISYITEKDSPPPVRAEGLNLISGLVHAGSPIVDIPALLVLLSTLIRDDEDFMNLRVIKVYTQVADKHPKSVVEELLDRYVDAKELSSTDFRLRFGEALLQVIQRLGQTFSADIATRTGEVLLSVAGRRGHRPKTEARQAREQRMRALRQEEAQEAWHGEVPDMSDQISEEAQLRNEVFGQIVEGWESKRGSEDVRMRSSAVSIFSAAMDTNLAGLGSTLTAVAVDLCINILKLEPELEKAILRRSAIVLILSFVRGLDTARREKRRLGFSLTDSSRQEISRTLRYISATDTDGLVREHARDVAESLENCNISRLLPEPDDDGSSILSRLAGLGAGPLGKMALGSGRPSMRPRIEEVEQTDNE